MTSRLCALALIYSLVVAAGLALPSESHAVTVRMETVLGDIDVLLLDDLAPITVTNFLGYVNAGDYDDSFIHRSARNTNGTPFVIQGGGFNFVEGSYGQVSSNGFIGDEFNRSNLRGTLAMAKGSQGASNQWFFNVGNNPGLNAQNFTVFGEVLGDGMQVVDAIAALTFYNASPIHPALSQLPLVDFTPGDVISDHLVLVHSVRVVPEPATGLLLAGGLVALSLRRRGPRR